MAEPIYREPRVHEWQGGIYVIRDVLNASGQFSGQCEYATLEDGAVWWRQCAEGVLYADIKPMVRLSVG